MNKQQEKAVIVKSAKQIIPAIKKMMAENEDRMMFEVDLKIKKSNDEAWADDLSIAVKELFKDYESLKLMVGWSDSYNLYHIIVDIETILCDISKNATEISSNLDIPKIVGQILKISPEDKTFEFNLVSEKMDSSENILSEETLDAISELFDNSSLSLIACWCGFHGCYHISLKIAEVVVKVIEISSFDFGRDYPSSLFGTSNLILDLQLLTLELELRALMEEMRKQAVKGNEETKH